MGSRGIFAGWVLSWIKDGLGCAAFFATFECVKSQAFYAFVTRFYARRSEPDRRRRAKRDAVRTIRPHFAIEPAFLLLAGASASVVQSLIQYPMNLIQEIHYQRIDALDRLARQRVSAVEMLKGYWVAYRRTGRICARMAQRAGGLRRWLYQGFMMNTLRQVPSTSAGLIIFELVRRRYADDREAISISVDGSEILLM